MANKNELVVAPVEYDHDIEHVGSKITLPAEPKPMSTEDAIKVLKRKLEEENTILDVREDIIGHPHDALIAFHAAMKEIYGWAQAIPKMTFFGPMAPDLMTIKTGPKEHEKVQVLYGTFTLPNIEKPIETHFFFHPTESRLVVTGSVRKKEQGFLTKLAALTREKLKTGSIYKGKAIRLKCDDDGKVNFNDLTFLETDSIAPETLVLNDDEWAQATASIWTPIRHTDKCLKHGVPLKRGILLEGRYGTGKTMTAHVTSKECVENGWTYILLDDVRGLKDAILFAQRYQPAVVFAEDIDRVAENRDQEGNDLLNTIDGILTKNSQVITVLTTNHVEKINPAMMRPGRFDAVISIRAPEGEAVRRLIRLYGGSLIDADDPLELSVSVMEGNIPATIREVVERSKLSMIAHGREQVTDEDLRISAVSMRAHLDLLNRKPKDVTREEAAGIALRELLSAHSEEAEDLAGEMRAAAKSVRENATAVARHVATNLKATEAAANSTGAKLDEVKKDTAAIRKAVV